MKALRTMLLAGAALAFLATLAGCGGGGAEQYGEAISLTERTPVADILSDPQALDGTVVRIEGVIQSECPSGCWFTLDDDGAVIWVDLAPHGIAIPQRIGSPVIVEGPVRITESRTMVLGSGVELR